MNCTSRDVFDHIIGQAVKVRWRGNDRALITCPAHDDRHPSLSVRRGDHGVLVKCWAGCSFTEICTACGVEPRELFYDHDDKPRTGVPFRRPRSTYRPRSWRQWASDLLDEALAYRVRGERMLRSFKSEDTFKWSELQFDIAGTLVSLAYEDISIAKELKLQAFGIRRRGLEKEHHLRA